MTDSTVLVLNGPNLNMLGLREPAVYGSTTLAELDEVCRKAAEAVGWRADCRQSNWEGQLVDWIHEARDAHDGIVINAGALTHTSVALHDAIAAAERPTVEVHLSNIYKREPFRHKSFVSPVAVGVICGLGSLGYALAIRALAEGRAV